MKMSLRNRDSASSIGRILMLSVVLLLLFVAPASAQYVDRNDDIRFDTPVKNQFYLAPRIRAILIPSWILGAWYEEHATHWDDRANLAYGMEFVWRKVGAYEIGAAVEYADLSMPSGFWLEKGDSPEQADYTEIDLKLVSLVASGYWYWDVQPWLSPYVGGGLGLGIVLGDITRYDPVPGTSCERALGGSNPFAPDACFGPDGKPDPSAIDLANKKIEDRVPSIVPVLNLTGGLRFNIHEHFIAKMEVGFYNYLFAGLSLGAQW